jgi:lipopolysaccharide export system protein LptA
MVTAEAAAGEVATENPLEVMKRIMIPSVQFNNAEFQDVVEWMQKASIEYDGKKRGVNFVLDLKGKKPGEITFSARFITLLQALNTCTEVSGLTYRIAGNVVMIVPDKNVPDKNEAIDVFKVEERPWVQQIEIEVQFVAFDSTNVEKLVATGRLNVDTLTNLWLNGGGHLLAAPRVRTPAGQEAVVKNVVEYIYPTTFSVSNEDHAGTNNASMTDTHTSAAVTVPKRMVRSPVVVPCDFVTREVGTILQVLPELNPDGALINLAFNAQIVGEPVVKDYGSKYVDANGKEQQARMEQPFFRVNSISSNVSLRDGERILVGGYRPSGDGTEAVYIIVSARIVGTEARVQGDRIQGDKMEYNAVTKELAASGNVVITKKDGSTLKGEKVVIKTDENATVVSGAAKLEVKPDGKK